MDDGSPSAPAAGSRYACEVHGLRVEIDPDLCVGFADCLAEAPEAFDLDESGVAFFTRPDAVARHAFLDACAACPVDAITVWDEGGEQLIP